MKLDHQFTSYTKISSWWIKELNISSNTIKVLDENITRKISDILHSNILTDMSAKARDIKERINQWDLIKIRSFRGNQDGGIGRHTTPPHATRTDRKSNRKEARHQGDEKEAFIQTRRRCGDGQLGLRGLVLLDPETDRVCAGSPTASRPCSPTFAHK